MKSFMTSMIFMVVFVSQSSGAVLFSDDFEKYPINEWPSGWMGFGGNESDHLVNQVEGDPDDPKNKIFRLTSLDHESVGAGANALLSSTNHITIHFRVFNGSETILQNENALRGTLSLRHGDHWNAITNPKRQLIGFYQEGFIIGGDGTFLQPFNSHQWYDVTVEYFHKNTGEILLKYTIDGEEYKPLTSLPILLDEQKERSLDHIEISVGSGSVYFDDIVVTAVPEPASWILAGISLVLLVTALVIRKLKG